ncbi:MAG: right-handed parallel beta-helix repeat-containing protein, partial [Candidatus Bipolaricaulota bacterium]|nr:right-handed parallel beta-helix repeat-containing protein [Candidatus Bipolaricaulota bacterium]
LAVLGGHVIILRSIIRENKLGIAHWFQEDKEEFILYKSTLSENSILALQIFSSYSHLPKGSIGEIVENEIVKNGGGIYMASVASGSWIGISNNRIAYNADYGVAISHPECPQLKSLFPLLPEGLSAPIQIAGKQNEIRDNDKGDLCPLDYPWPPGFRK